MYLSLSVYLAVYLSISLSLYVSCVRQCSVDTTSPVQSSSRLHLAKGWDGDFLDPSHSVLASLL